MFQYLVSVPSFLFSFVGFFLLISGCGPRDSAYVDIVIDGNLVIKGIGEPIRSCESRVNCTFLDYEDGRLVRVVFYHYGSVRDSSTYNDDHTTKGPSQIRFTYEGDWETRSYLGSDGKLRRDLATVRIKRNPEGYPESMFIYDEHGDPIDELDGPHRYDYFWDPETKQLSQKAPGEHGELLELPGYEDVYELRNMFDARGNTVRTTLYGLGGRPAFSGYPKHHQSMAKYDEYDRPTNVTYWDSQEELISGDAYPITQFIYEENCLVEMRFHDANSRIEKSIRHQCDAFGNVIVKEEYGADGRLQHNEYSRIEYTRDASGRVVSKKYFEDKGIPGKGYRGAHHYAYTYDEYGRMVERTCFDESGNPTTEEVDLYYYGTTETHDVHRAERIYVPGIMKYDSVIFYDLNGELITEYGIDYGDTIE